MGDFPTVCNATLQATLHCLKRHTTCKILNGHQGDSKMADVVWKEVLSLVFGHFKQLCSIKFFIGSSHSMKNIDDGEKKRKKKMGENRGPHI